MILDLEKEIQNLQQDRLAEKLKNAEEIHEAELKLLRDKIKKQEIILNFVLSVLKKGEIMMKSRQNVIEVQSAYIEEKESMLGQCKALQDTVSEQQELIASQSSKISELQKTITSNEQLKVAYEKIRIDFGEKNNCDISDWVTSMAEGLARQRENINLLTSSMQHNDKLESSCRDLKESFSKFRWESKENSSLISHYQTLLQKQSETITMFRSKMTGFEYHEENGLVVYGSPCECLPLPPTNSSLQVTSVKFDCQGTEGSYHVSCGDGKCDVDDWPECSNKKTKEELEKDDKIQWLYSDCSASEIAYLNATLDCGDMDDLDDDDDGNVALQVGHKMVILEESRGEGVFRQEYTIPCLNCEIFEWSSWSNSGQGRITRVRGNNTVVAGSYQEEEKHKMRLVGGNGNNTGNVYVTNSEGIYGPICDDERWNVKAATIVCKELGFNRGAAITNSYFGYIDSRYAMDDVECSGSEKSILQCRHETSNNCGNDEAAGVLCE